MRLLDQRIRAETIEENSRAETKHRFARLSRRRMRRPGKPKARRHRNRVVRVFGLLLMTQTDAECHVWADSPVILEERLELPIARRRVRITTGNRKLRRASAQCPNRRYRIPHLLEQ